MWVIRFILFSYGMNFISHFNTHISNTRIHLCVYSVLCTHIHDCDFFLFSQSQHTHFIITCLRSSLWLKKDKNNSIWFASANSFKTEIHLVWLCLAWFLGLGLVSCFKAAFVFDFTYFAVLLFLLLLFLVFFSRCRFFLFHVFGYHITYSCICVHYVIKSSNREKEKKIALQLKCFVFNFDGITLKLQAWECQ